MPKIETFLKAAEPKKPMTLQQWSAFASAVTGKKVSLVVPTPEEMSKYG